MRRVKYSLILLLVLGTVSSVSAQSEDVEQFQWLVGNWKGNHNDGVFYESWEKADNNTFIGKAYNVVKSDTLFKEQIQIQKIGKFWVYIATIEEGYPVLFTLINSDETKWTFVNYEHDFPQRIVYTQVEEKKLHVLIESDAQGVNVKENYLLDKY